MNSLLEPGMFVRNPQAPEWGIGQVQSNAGGKVTVNFEEMGKIVVNITAVELEPVFDF